MKRPLIPMVLLLLLLTACSTETQTVAEPVADPTEPIVQTEAETTEPETAPETEPGTEPSAAAVYTGEPHVFDECGVLDGDALAHYNTYLDNLANSRLICAAAVITDSLNGAEPEAFARDYYRSLYSTESGFLVLINNDTGQDVIYREGVCETYITNTALPIAQATPHLVTCDYAGALDILLPVGEAMPERVFERSGTLSGEELAQLLELAQADPEKNCVYLAYGLGWPDAGEEEERLFADHAEELRSRIGAQNLLLIDVTQKRCAIAGAPPELLASQVQETLTAQGAFHAAQQYYAGIHPEETAVPSENAESDKAAETEETTLS